MVSRTFRFLKGISYNRVSAEWLTIRNHDNGTSKANFGGLSLTLKEQSSKIITWVCLHNQQKYFENTKMGVYLRLKLCVTQISN